MKNLYFIILFLFTSLLFGQKKGLIYYGYIDALGIGNAKGPDSNAYMVFNNESSYYVTAKDSLEKAEKLNEQKIYTNDEDKGGSIQFGMGTSRIGDQVYFSIKKNMIWSNFLWGKQVFANETATKLKWTITNDAKKIGKFDCKKATATFRGRDYIAWFTSDIPVSFGPWKLNGLPGLILEAYDTNKNVFWYFKSVAYPSDTQEAVRNIRNIKGQKTNYLTIAELKKDLEEKLQTEYERVIVVVKQFPGVVAQKGTMKGTFIEILDGNE